MDLDFDFNYWVNL